MYRVLKLHGLVREVNVVGFPAGPEYTVKTTRVNEQWQSDASYFFVMGWGWYYLISVLDDFSRYILAWQLKGDMKTESISEVVERAIAAFIEFYNQRRYHEGIGNVAPVDVYYRRLEEILKRREEQKRQTLYERFEYNRAQRSHATRLLTAPNTNNPSVALIVTTTTETGEPDASNHR